MVYLIVGAGMAGCVMAERLASLGHEIYIVDRRNHIGGNCYDQYNLDGILIHSYGPHIFRTDCKEIWDYVSRFTPWHYYQHIVLAYVDGVKVPFPINADTVSILMNKTFSVDDLKKYLEEARSASVVEQIENARDMAVSMVGQELYEKLFKNYTQKQWGVQPEELAGEVTSRIPVRCNRDPRYFDVKYQGVPKYGYTRMFMKMLDHPAIHILLQTDYKQIVNSIAFDRLIYTGSIDYFFDYKYGVLPYRSLRFEFETLPREFYQEVGTINYPNDYDFTRITEFKYLTGQIHPWTTIACEYPTSKGDPYYPIPNVANHDLYNCYRQEACALEHVYFIGRLAEYRYFSMDQIINQCFRLLPLLEQKT